MLLYVKNGETFFEPKHFEHFVLSKWDLKTFSCVMKGPKRKLVKHIWLTIELIPYTCPECTKSESGEIADYNNIIFKKMVQILFQTLSTWDKSTDLHREGLTLELSACSPSDSKHLFRDLNFDHDPYREPSKNFIVSPDLKLSERKFDDHWHLWRQGRRVPVSQDEENRLIHGIMRVQGLGFYFQLPRDDSDDERPPHSASYYLPKVDVVTSFLFRRQYYRYIHPDGLSQLFESLVGLEHIVYEPPKVLYCNNSNSKPTSISRKLTSDNNSWANITTHRVSDRLRQLVTNRP